MCGNMCGKQVKQKKKSFNDVQMDFCKNRIPSNDIVLYTFSIVTQIGNMKQWICKFMQIMNNSF